MKNLLRLSEAGELTVDCGFFDFKGNRTSVRAGTDHLIVAVGLFQQSVTDPLDMSDVVNTSALDCGFA